MSGWAGFLAVVVALRLAGLGSAPPEVGAASADVTGRAADPASTVADRAFGWLVRGFDVAAFAPAAERCLDAGPACAADDLLDLDTTRIRLASLVDLIEDATDPSAPGYLGRPDGWVAKHVAGTRSAAAAAADALGRFLSEGCAGSIDGVVVTQRPTGGGGWAVDARRGLGAVATALGEWP
jgi:hypothetical protein